MSSQIICIDPGPVIQLTTFPRNNAIKTLWDRWEKEQRRILAPSNLFYDVTNVLAAYVRQGMLSPRTVQSILQACRALPIHTVDDPDLAALDRQGDGGRVGQHAHGSSVGLGLLQHLGLLLLQRAQLQEGEHVQPQQQQHRQAHGQLSK